MVFEATNYIWLIWLAINDAHGMKRLLTVCLFLTVTFSLSAFASISIGRGQPASKAIQYWHLTDCAPPCWAGITPNLTSPYEAVDRFRHLFGGFKLVQMDDRTVGWARNDVPTKATTYVSLGFVRGLVSGIGIFTNDTSETMPTFGELVAIFGAPTCIVILNDYLTLYYEDPSSQVIVHFGADDLSATKSIDGISMGSRGNLSCQDLNVSAVPWRGFRSIELYLAEP